MFISNSLISSKLMTEAAESVLPVLLPEGLLLQLQSRHSVKISVKTIDKIFFINHNNKHKSRILAAFVLVLVLNDFLNYFEYYNKII